MIAIFDRQAGHLPLAELLLAVVQHALLALDDPVSLTRMGGLGEAVWKLESKLDNGEALLTSVGDLLDILNTEGQHVDELRCRKENVCFGLFDADFLFLQAGDKDIEKKIAAQFRDVQVRADHF